MNSGRKPFPASIVELAEALTPVARLMRRPDPCRRQHVSVVI
jgi:hypothetical protein